MSAIEAVARFKHRVESRGCPDASGMTMDELVWRGYATKAEVEALRKVVEADLDALEGEEEGERRDGRSSR